MALWSGLTANMVKVRFVLCAHVMAEIKITSALYVFYVNGHTTFDIGYVVSAVKLPFTHIFFK